MAFTQAFAKPAGLPGDRQVSLGEAPAGSAPPIVAWYPAGERLGHRFLYSH